MLPWEIAVFYIPLHRSNNIQRQPLAWNTHTHICAPKVHTHTHSQGRNSGRAGPWRQALMQRSWRDAAYWLAPHGLLGLPSYSTQDYQPRDGPPPGWALPPLIPNFIIFLRFRFILCTLAFCLHVSLREDVRSPETGVTDRCKLPCGCWELNPGPPEDQLDVPNS